MSKKFPIYIHIDELTDIQNKVELKVDGKNTIAYNTIGSLGTIRIKVPVGTLYKINQILLQHLVGEVYYIREYKLWYVLLIDQILWSNFEIKSKKPEKESKRRVKKPHFNRYTALIREKGD